jgi:hypothetical protein
MTNDRGDPADGGRRLDDKVSELAGRYRALRERKRLLAPGEFDEDLSGAGGKLQETLVLLGRELGHHPFTKSDIVKYLGEPDSIMDGEQMAEGGYLGIYKRELEQAGRKWQENRSREYLIYFWRGFHDFMFFVCEGGAVVDHGWWFAYE